MSLDSKKRVKVYKMVESVWDDQGTGYVEFSMLEPYDYPGIVVKSEDDSVSKYLLKTKVSRELNIYVRQQDTLIVWNEASETDPTSDGTDLAISFQEAEGCQEFWNELHEIQNTLNTEYSLGDESCVEDSFSLNNDEIEFPIPSMTTLDSIMSLFDLLSPLQCKIMASALIAKSFLPGLFAFFKTIDASQTLPLKKAFYILKKLFCLNSRELLDQLSDIYFFDVLYIIDHDPDNKSVNHTEFIKEKVKFVEVISFNDEAFEKKVHQTFRLTFLKDVVFPRYLDDSVLGTMGTMIFLNSVQLVTHFFTSKLTETLFLKMRSPELTSSVLSDCLKLIIELCGYSISLEARNRFLFYKSFVTNGLFDVLQHTLSNPESEVRKLSTVILLNTIDFDSSVLRLYLLEKNQTGNQLFKIILETFVNETHYVTKTLLYEVIRGALDTLHIGPDEAVLNQIVDINHKLEEEKSNVMNIFYQEFALSFFSPLFNEPPPEHTPVDTFLKSSLCDLLAVFVDHHPQQTKLFIMKHNVIPKIFNLLKAKEKNLKLGPIRVLRRIISASNKFYHTYIIENNLFAPVIDVFLENGDKYNALNSAILDIFHFIGINKTCRPLVKYFVENFYNKVQDITYVQTFKNLSILNETPDYYMEEDKFAVDSIRERNRKKYQEEEKEESWFDSDDDYSLSTNMIIEDLNCLEPKTVIEKRKFDEASSGDSPMENAEVNSNISDSPRPKRLKYSNSTGSLQF